MKKYSLSANVRKITGRKVKQLRRLHLVPANVFGKNVASLSVELPLSEFNKVYSQAGETGLVELRVDGVVRPVLIHHVQVHPLTQTPLHADFYQVDLKQKIKTHVPLEITGSAPAVAQKMGVLLTLLDEVEIEALPTDLPEKLVVDVGQLVQVGATIKVADLSLPSNAVVLTDKDTEVVKIGELVSKEAEALAAEEEAAKAAAAAQAATTTGGVPSTEGQAEAPATAAKIETPPASVPKAEEKKPA